MKIKISIIVPAYNEGENIGKVLGEIRELFPDFETVVIDDGSDDSTHDIARIYFPETTLRHHKNLGLGASLKTGIRHATGDFVICVDADGQHPLESVREIARLIQGEPGIDAVLTERENAYSSGAVRSIGKLMINWVTRRLTGERIRDVNCGLRAFRRQRILPFLFLLPDGFSFSTTSTILAYKENFRFKWVRITMGKREGGKSQVRIRHGLDTLILVCRLIVLFDPLRFFLPVTIYSILLGVVSILLSLMTSETIGKNYIFFFLFASLSFLLGLISEQMTTIRKEIVQIKNDN